MTIHNILGEKIRKLAKMHHEASYFRINGMGKMILTNLLMVGLIGSGFAQMISPVRKK